MLAEIIYHSQAVAKFTETDVDDILKMSRKNNAKNGITGCLLFHKKQFLQILEGEKEVISALYNKIRKDHRHQNVITLHVEDIKDRIFSEWAMAYQNFDDQEKIENTIGFNSLKEILKRDNSGNISKEIFKTMSLVILNSN